MKYFLKIVIIFIDYTITTFFLELDIIFVLIDYLLELSFSDSFESIIIIIYLPNLNEIIIFDLILNQKKKLRKKILVLSETDNGNFLKLFVNIKMKKN